MPSIVRAGREVAVPPLPSRLVFVAVRVKQLPQMVTRSPQLGRCCGATQIEQDRLIVGQQLDTDRGGQFGDKGGVLQTDLARAERFGDMREAGKLPGDPDQVADLPTHP